MRQFSGHAGYWCFNSVLGAAALVSCYPNRQLIEVPLIRPEWGRALVPKVLKAEVPRVCFSISDGPQEYSVSQLTAVILNDTWLGIRWSRDFITARKVHGG